MSIHAKISPEAQARLDANKRHTTISSIVIALLSILLLGILMALLVIAPIFEETPVIVTYAANTPAEEVVATKKMSTNIKQKPSAPAAFSAKVIAVATASDIAIPVPEVDVPQPSIDFGNGDDFGSGWGDGGFGDGAGGGGGFGSSEVSSGGLTGYFYAIEHAKNSTPNHPRVKAISDPDFWSKLVRIQSAQFSSQMLNDFYRSPNALYLTNLAIPNTVSAQGPQLFGAGHVQGRYWLAHYSGTVTVPSTGTYRFSGVGDNYLHVLIDGKPVMHYGGAIPSGWEKEVSDTTQHQSPYTKGWWVRYGKWINLRAGQSIKMDIGIAEGAGGWCGFMLQLEEKSTKYRSASTGRPILPLFTTAPFSEAEVTTLRQTFPQYELDFDNYLIFRVKR